MKFASLERKVGALPLILKVDPSGLPSKWIHWQDVVVAKFTGKILWELGEPINLTGGTSAQTGLPSLFDLFPIVAYSDQTASKSGFRPPPLTNRELFRRDHNQCLYCGGVFPASKLTRDHVIPTSKGGPNTWKNTVCACEKCNALKADRTPEEARMPLLAVPYVPSRGAHLILQNRKIISDQQEYLLTMMKEPEIKRLFSGPIEKVKV